MSLKKTVLIVDDNKVNRRMLSLILCSQYKILEAENGKSALLLLQNAYASISVILLDLVMPIMNGYELLAEINRDAFLRNIPVVVISQKEAVEGTAKALSFGVQDFIQLDSEPDEIKGCIESTLALKKASDILNLIQRDTLTGLYAKKYFYSLAEKTLRNNPQKKYDIICCDIERFKLVNELFGFHEGDALLKYVALMVRNKFEERGICGRIGGDIFAALVEHQDTYGEEDFSECVEYINRFNENLHSVIKFGIYPIDDISLPVSIMCARACLALESIKGKYIPYHALYDDSIRQKLLEEQFILSNMKAALINREFVVYYQPKYDLMSEKISSAEALVRWLHPERGLIPPNRFIKIFEDNGFITELDLYVLEESCRWIRSWINRGNPPIPVSVNMSRADIYNPNIDAILLSLLEKYQLSPNHIFIEITESAYTENSEQIIEGIKQLKDLGFTIEMDDFGSDYSSLNMLSEIPIDVLKLDMRFVQDQEKFRDKRSVMSFVISLAKWMNLKVIAEGVETEEQVNLLKILGCHSVQGFFFSKPLPLHAFEALIDTVNFNAGDAPGDITLSENKTILNLEAKQNCMLIYDTEGEEFDPFQKIFADKFTVLKANTQAEALQILNRQKADIAILIFAVTKSISVEEMLEISYASREYDIPMITIHTTKELITKAISFGALDCIFKPYLIETLENRVNNTLSRMKALQFQNETQFNDAIAEMKKRAEVDFLSGLLNRSELKMRIQEYFNGNQRFFGTFILIDIDHFKSINVALGYGMGDRVLCAIGQMLESAFYETNLISRMDGDLFAVFLPLPMDEKALTEKLVKMCHTVAYDNSNLKLSLTCSAGVCFSGEYAKNYEELYQNAEIALLNAKENQKDKVFFYEEGMRMPQKETHGQNAFLFLDDVTDGIFVCDTLNGEILYINDAACKLIQKTKESCIGMSSYQLFGGLHKNFDFCFEKKEGQGPFHEEENERKDMQLHLKAKPTILNGKRLIFYYLQKEEPRD